MGYEPLHDRFRFDRTVLHEGVPAWMRKDLIGLLSELLKSVDGLPEVIHQTLRLDVGVRDRRGDLITLTGGDDELALEMLHLSLTHVQAHERAEYPDDPGSIVVEVYKTLERCQSAWTIAVQGDHFGLQRRVDATVHAAAETAMDSPTSAAGHLRDAWTACYRRDADPDRAMRATVFALEAALAPIVTPDDPRPSLGKISAALRDAPHKWTLPLDATDTARGREAVPPTVTLAAELEHVWRTHRRHIDRDGNAHGNTPSEAEAAVHVAVHTVHLVHRGLLSTNG